MSNYTDQSCSNCLKTQAYTPLRNTADYSCNQQCSCRDTNERSDKDKIYFDFYVLGKPMRLDPQQESYLQSINSHQWF